MSLLAELVFLFFRVAWVTENIILISDLYGKKRFMLSPRPESIKFFEIKGDAEKDREGKLALFLCFLMFLYNLTQHSTFMKY